METDFLNVPKLQLTREHLIQPYFFRLYLLHYSSQRRKKQTGKLALSQDYLTVMAIGRGVMGGKKGLEGEKRSMKW